MDEVSEKNYEERPLKAKSGWLILGLSIVLMLIAVAAFVVGGVVSERINEGLVAVIFIAGTVILTAGIFISCGLKIINPNEALVLVLFGRYVGTVSQDGFFFVNPFAVKHRISLKARTLTNDKQKVNDERGNPIEIGVIVIWRVSNTAKAMFKVENYNTYVTTQADSAIRNVARQYPYDINESDATGEKSLRGSSQEIADVLKNELQTRVQLAGIDIIEARISHLAYAQEIAAAMLQRQQAEAIVAARQKIVEGAVGMVEMALNMLNENGIVKLDDERKAAMVSNLLVVLCANKDAQPIVNSGTIY